MATERFELFADYFQFYLQDEAASGDLSDAWTPEAVEQLLAIGPGVIGVGTVRNVDVPVEIEVATGAGRRQRRLGPRERMQHRRSDGLYRCCRVH